MKKLLLVLAVASFVACNDAGTEGKESADSTAAAPAPDSSAMAPAPTPDSAATSADTTKPADSTIKK